MPEYLLRRHHLQDYPRKLDLQKLHTYAGGLVRANIGREVDGGRMTIAHHAARRWRLLLPYWKQGQIRCDNDHGQQTFAGMLGEPWLSEHGLPIGAPGHVAGSSNTAEQALSRRRQSTLQDMSAKCEPGQQDSRKTHLEWQLVGQKTADQI